MTNYERIKNMSVEEMVRYNFRHGLNCSHCIAQADCRIRNSTWFNTKHDCFNFVRVWLNEEVEE